MQISGARLLRDELPQIAESAFSGPREVLPPHVPRCDETQVQAWKQPQTIIASSGSSSHPNRHNKADQPTNRGMQGNLQGKRSWKRTDLRNRATKLDSQADTYQLILAKVSGGLGDRTFYSLSGIAILMIFGSIAVLPSSACCF